MRDLIAGCGTVIAALIGIVLTVAALVLGVGVLGVMIVAALPVVIIVGGIIVLFFIFAL